MDGGAVIALAVVLKDEFPVRFDLVFHRRDQFKLIHLPSLHLLDDRSKVCDKIRGDIIGINHDEATPVMTTDTLEAEVRRIERFNIFHVGSANQFAVTPIRPSMVGAGDASVF